MELAWLQKCTPDYLKLSEVSTLCTFSDRKWTGFVQNCRLCFISFLDFHVFFVSDLRQHLQIRILDIKGSEMTSGTQLAQMMILAYFKDQQKVSASSTDEVCLQNLYSMDVG